MNSRYPKFFAVAVMLCSFACLFCSISPVMARGHHHTKKAKAAHASRTVYITDSGTKYHRAGCRCLRRSKTPISLNKAKQEGYTPCSLCNP